MEHLLTVKDIAAKRQLSPDYVGNLTRMKGFPDPKLTNRLDQAPIR